MGQVQKNPKDRQVITLLTEAEETAFLQLCDANQMNRSEMLRHLVRTAIRPKVPSQAFDPTMPRDPDGFEYEEVIA